MSAEDVRERGGVPTASCRRGRSLNRCSSPRMPFTWTVNPYPRLRHGLPLLLRRLHPRVHGHHDAGRRSTRSSTSRRAAEEETARRLAPSSAAASSIALGTATDPYQPGEAQAGVTRRFLEMAARHSATRASASSPRARSSCATSICCRRSTGARGSPSTSRSSRPTPTWLRKLDPWAPPPDVRIDVMRRLVEAGIEVWLGLAPVLPGLTDDETSLDDAARPGGGRRRAPHVHERALPALAHQGEVPPLAGGGRSPATRRPTRGRTPGAPTSRGPLPRARSTPACARLRRKARLPRRASGRRLRGAAGSSLSSEPARC